MKKVYIIVLALFLVGSFSAQAQIKLGLKGGLNLPSLSSTDNTVSLSSNTGWHAGAMVEVKLAMIGIQGDIIYSQNSHVVDMSSISFTGDLKNTTLDIPIVAKLYLFKILTIQAGPQFSFLTSSKLGDIDVKKDIKEGNFKFVAGLGVNLGPIDVHGRFIFPTKTTIGTAGDELKNSNIQLSVGFWLKK